MNEDEEQEQADCYLNDTQRVEPLTKANLHIVLDGDADKVVVQDEGSVYPTKFIRYGKHGNQDKPQEGMLEDQA